VVTPRSGKVPQGRQNHTRHTPHDRALFNPEHRAYKFQRKFENEHVRPAPITRLAEIVDRRLKQAGSKSPGLHRLTKLIEIIYLTSLKTEEGKPLQVRVALIDPSNPDPDRPPVILPDRWTLARLERRLPLTVPNLIKLSKAADPWSSTLAAFYDSKGEFFVWGMTDQTVHFSVMLVQETEWGGFAPPGILQIAATGVADLTASREFDFVARLQQDQLLTRQSDVFSPGPILDRLSEAIISYFSTAVQRLGQSPLAINREPADYTGWAIETWTRTIRRLLISIQRYRHGGALLISDSRKGLSIKYRMEYPRLRTLLTEFAIQTIQAEWADEEIRDYIDKDADSLPCDLYLDEDIAERDARGCERAITGAVRFISSLSCVDGLILATPDLVVRGFGAEIKTTADPGSVFLSSTPNPHKASVRRIDPTHYGTRHRSMMRYCFAHPKSVGFVISQDGEIRAMTRVRNRLIMWENLKVLSYSEMSPRKHKRAKK
jgi:hypothetical protein